MSEMLTSADGATESRLPNLQKLYHVPVFALRDLLNRRDSERTFGELHQGELVAKADKLLDITEADVDKLYENYRYGRSLAFYVYLLPTGLAQPALEDLQAALDEQAGLQQAGEEAEKPEEDQDALPSEEEPKGPEVIHVPRKEEAEIPEKDSVEES